MSAICRMRAARVGLGTIALALLLAAPSFAEVWVLCDVGSGEVVVEEAVDESRHVVMEGPLPGQRTAAVWLEENCPARRCQASGACGEAAQPPPSAAAWLVVCEPGSGAVGVVESPPPAGFLLLPGRDGAARQHADFVSAQEWAEENCPSRRCDAEGRCAGAGAVIGSRSATGGWVAGEVTSVTLSEPPGAVTPPAPPVAGPGAGPGGPAGPPSADLSPLVNNTKAAAKGCNFPAALASVDHMANFDPQHPFLVANRDNLRSLARRQRRTERTVWQASSALESGDLKGARGIAQAAADTAVGCQSRAVAALLDGIDTAIKQTRELKTLKRRRAASRLLPGLVSLSNALIGAESGVPIDVEALMANTAASFGADLPLNALDPCAFKYEYRDKSSLEPVCTCSGYRFDVGKFRCVG